MPLPPPGERIALHAYRDRVRRLLAVASPPSTADLIMLAALCAATTASTPPRIAVFGGSGFVGSRVCQTLADAGCSVVAVSRTGAPPAWADAQPWSRQVEWLAADALADGFAESELPIGRIDGRPRPSSAAPVAQTPVAQTPGASRADASRADASRADARRQSRRCQSRS